MTVLPFINVTLGLLVRNLPEQAFWNFQSKISRPYEMHSRTSFLEHMRYFQEEKGLFDRLVG